MLFFIVTYEQEPGNFIAHHYFAMCPEFRAQVLISGSMARRGDVLLSPVRASSSRLSFIIYCLMKTNVINKCGYFKPERLPLRLVLRVPGGLGQG